MHGPHKPFNNAQAPDSPPAHARPVNRPGTRPKNLRLISIRLPLPALISILHRLSGVLLFLSLPALLWLLSLSLQSAAGFEHARAILSSPMLKLLQIGLVWAFLHHFLAGLRHMSLDLHFGLELAQARLSSKLVLILGLLLTAVAGVALW